jgi:E3 ubiquitin-protein ligase ATL23
MMGTIFMALLLPCAGTGVVFIIYICLLWHTANRQNEPPLSVKPVAKNGLSESELDKLPKVTGKELVLGTECAVCLDEIESRQPARLIPGCHHGFHVECADTWLSKHSVCPVCRAELEPQLFNGPENPC